MVIFECRKTDAPFYEVKDPAVIGTRVQLNSAKPVMLAVLAQKTAGVPLFVRPPQQSDYAAEWQAHQQSALKTKPSGSGLVHRLRVAASPYWPFWLRRLKFRLMNLQTYGRPSLKNARQFRRLSWREIISERSRPGVE
jgi:hypothetical protein